MNEFIVDIETIYRYMMAKRWEAEDVREVASSTIRVADEVWIATALLHFEQPDRPDFTVKEIEQRVAQENIAGTLRKGVYPHASLHCVANFPPNPARHRMLYATSRSRRRLFREGDDFHRAREGGRVRPEPGEIPGRYRYLLDWYRRGVTTRESSPDPLLELRGSGRDVWADEPADQYLERLREGW